jgi:VIT1/CCC1 family predicted Fe2+/Mn2+ transporter
MTTMSRPARASTHIEPRGLPATARHYVRDLVYGASDGIITTFAVVGGVAGGALPSMAVLVVGLANLAADGVSMGVGNFQAIRAHERAREVDALPEEETYPWKHGIATLLAFIVAGSIPLLPYLLPGSTGGRLAASAALTLTAMFALGAVRASITREPWWRSSLETVGLGTVVAATAYGAGALASAIGAQ